MSNIITEPPDYFFDNFFDQIAGILGISIIGFFLIIFIFFLIPTILVIIFVYKDASEKDLGPVLWIVVTLIFGWVVGLLFYIIVRASKSANPTLENVKEGENSKYYSEYGLRKKNTKKKPPIQNESSESTKVCKFCGAILPKDLEICSNCGSIED